MPSKSRSQHRLTEAVVAGRSTAVPLEVAKEYLEADKNIDISSLPEHAPDEHPTKPKPEDTP